MRYLIPIFILLTASVVTAQTTHSIILNITANTTLGKVFIPGYGERDILGLSPVAAPSSYLASYKSESLLGIVYSQFYPIRMEVTSNQSDHTLSLALNLTNSQAFIVFTQGNYRKIEQRMPLIRAGTFLDEIYPVFGYSLGTLRPVRMVLNYSDIDIQGNLTFRKGTHTLTIESRKVGSRKIVVFNETVNA